MRAPPYKGFPSLGTRDVMDMYRNSRHLPNREVGACFEFRWGAVKENAA